jgi:hypothetical protein
MQGKVSYEWEVEGGSIIKGNNTRTITIDTKSKKDGDEISINITAVNEEDCSTTSYKKLVVKKLKAKPKTKTTNKKA